MKKTLIITNIITFALLIGVLVLERQPKLKNQSLLPDFATLYDTYSYVDNPNYAEYTDLFTAYSGQKNIVMFGNSLTNRVSWNELLNRNDIANRGIDSDITEGLINRIEFVLNVQPKICFIEGGINDLEKNIDEKIIINNLNTIVDIFYKNNIKPIITTVTLVAKNSNDACNFNTKIKKLNAQIIKLAQKKKIVVIDLNPKLTDGTFLKSEYAFADGVHFTSKAYKIWREEILYVLKRENI